MHYHDVPLRNCLILHTHQAMKIRFRSLGYYAPAPGAVQFSVAENVQLFNVLRLKMVPVLWQKNLGQHTAYAAATDLFYGGNGKG